MADRDDTTYNRSAGGVAATTIAVIALIVGIIALWLAWVAYERTGADLDRRIQEATQQAWQNLEQGAQNTEEAIDAGPDGVDQDDTNTNTTTPDATTEQNNDTTQ